MSFEYAAADADLPWPSFRPPLQVALRRWRFSSDLLRAELRPVGRGIAASWRRVGALASTPVLALLRRSQCEAVLYYRPGALRCRSRRKSRWRATVDQKVRARKSAAEAGDPCLTRLLGCQNRAQGMQEGIVAVRQEVRLGCIDVSRAPQAILRGRGRSAPNMHFATKDSRGGCPTMRRRAPGTWVWRNPRGAMTRGLYRTRGPAVWRGSGSGTAPASRSCSFDPRTPDRLFVTTTEDGLWRTENVIQPSRTSC